MVLTENTQMLALGKRLGFHVRRMPGENGYELRMELGRRHENPAEHEGATTGAAKI